jgi:CDP-diacylglycerol--glycerol-3-phosphate 3-phosphatidyltransferase
MFFTIPTLLTWARIVAIPLIVGVFYLPLDGATRNLIATVMFVACALTDWLDGWLARRLNQTSSHYRQGHHKSKWCESRANGV